MPERCFPFPDRATRMRTTTVRPEDWREPRGYSHAILVAGATRILFLAGQIAWDTENRIVGEGDLAAQFGRALANVVRLVREAGGVPEHVVRMTIFVKDKRDYLAKRREIGEAYRAVFGRHYPAMSLVQVADLVEDGALVEIEATAALP